MLLVQKGGSERGRIGGVVGAEIVPKAKLCSQEGKRGGGRAKGEADTQHGGQV